MIMTETTQIAKDAAKALRHLTPMSGMSDAEIIQSAIDQSTASLQSRLQASEGERDKYKAYYDKLVGDSLDNIEQLEGFESENNQFRSRIAELEKLCGEAAECLVEHCDQFPCTANDLIARLQSAPPGHLTAALLTVQWPTNPAGRRQEENEKAH